MEDLLQALMQGSQQQSSAQDAGNEADPFVQLLQSMGGGASQGYGTQPGPAPAQGGMDLGSLLQGALGGGGGYTGASQASAGAGGLGDILGAIMGGGSSTMQSNSILAPIVGRLAEKLGLPPQLAQAVVAFVLGKLMQSRMQPGIDMTPDRAQPQAVEQPGPSLDTVVQRMNSGKRVKKTQIRKAGLADELASYTGMNRATAEASLQEVLNELGGQLGTGR
jgi:hypothetical protein